MAQMDQLRAFTAPAWAHASGVLSLERPRVMGVVNVTPDSFYDGGRLVSSAGVDLDAVARHCERLVRHGADVLDVGGESTRPGAVPISASIELDRVAPVIARVRDLGVPVSIDTRHAVVAAEAVRCGASIINDVSGLADARMSRVAAAASVGLVIGHLRGDPQTMQHDVRFADLLGDVTRDIASSVERAVAAGVERARIVVDPGVGFGKSAEHSAALVAAAGWLRQATGCPVMIGASRKSFIGVLSGADVGQRLPGSLAAAIVAVEHGASVIRVHDVEETVQALAMASAIRAAFERQLATASAGRGGLP